MRIYFDKVVASVRSLSLRAIVGSMVCISIVGVGAAVAFGSLGERAQRREEKVPLRPMVLSGSGAFYCQRDYIEKTRTELAAQGPLPPTEIFDSSSKTVRIIKGVFPKILVPWWMYDFFHTSFGSLFFQPSVSATIAEQARPRINLDSEWKYFRFSIVVDGVPVDAMVVGRPSTFTNGRWTLASLGITRIYECLLIDSPEQVCPGHPPGLAPLQQLLSKTQSNAILYNYPGMGASGGFLNLPAMVKAHEALLRFIEDQLHACVIIDKGHSFGGAVQAEAWRTHKVKGDVSYVLVKDRSPLYVIDAVQNLAGRFFAIAGKILGWNIRTPASSDTLQVPEIHVMCLGNISDSRRFIDPSEISPPGEESSGPFYNDQMVPYYSSTAIYYLQHPSCVSKVVIGVPDVHGASIEDPEVLAEAINEAVPIS